MSDDTPTNLDGEPVETLHELVQYHQREYDLRFEEETAMWRFVEDMHEHILTDMRRELQQMRMEEKDRVRDNCDKCQRSDQFCYSHNTLFRKIGDFIQRLSKPKFM